jgi:hypothetical protein
MIYRETAESRELTIYACNTSALYHNAIVPTVRNLAKKYAAGKYDQEKAVDAWYYVAESAVRMYEREFLSPGEGVRVFDVTARFSAAVELEEYYRENVENNDF